MYRNAPERRHQRERPTKSVSVMRHRIMDKQNALPSSAGIRRAGLDQSHATWRCSRQMALVAIPSWRPTKPRRSLVLALMLT